jgi:hypothetical protein
MGRCGRWSGVVCWHGGAHDIGHAVYVRPSYVHNGSRTKKLTEGAEGAVTRETNKWSQVTKGVDRKGGVIDWDT